MGDFFPCSPWTPGVSECPLPWCLGASPEPTLVFHHLFCIVTSASPPLMLLWRMCCKIISFSCFLSPGSLIFYPFQGTHKLCNFLGNAHAMVVVLDTLLFPGIDPKSMNMAVFVFWFCFALCLFLQGIPDWDSELRFGGGVESRPSHPPVRLEQKGVFLLCFVRNLKFIGGAGQLLHLRDPVSLHYHLFVGPPPPPEGQLLPLGKPLGLGVSSPGVHERLGWSEALVWKWWGVTPTDFLFSLKSCLEAVREPFRCC